MIQQQHQHQRSSKGGGDIQTYQIIQRHPSEVAAVAANYHNHSNSSASKSGTVSGSPMQSKSVQQNTNNSVGNSDASIEVSKALHQATQSMFSLRANKSMRLQRWGSWIAYHDTQSKSIFWYNHETSEGQWDVPKQVQLLQREQQTQTAQNAVNKVRSSNFP